MSSETSCVDDQLLGIGGLLRRHDVEQRALAVLVVDRLVQRDVLVERNVLLPRRRLDRGDDLTRDAQLGERAKARKLIGFEVAHGLVEADHPFLDDVFAVRADEKVALRLDANEVLVLVEQVFHREIVAGLRDGHQVFVDPLVVFHSIRHGMGHCHSFCLPREYGVPHTQAAARRARHVEA